METVTGMRFQPTADTPGLIFWTTLREFPRLSQNPIPPIPYGYSHPAEGGLKKIRVLKIGLSGCKSGRLGD